jgi:hypothetical protein
MIDLTPTRRVTKAAEAFSHGGLRLQRVLPGLDEIAGEHLRIGSVLLRSNAIRCPLSERAREYKAHGSSKPS